MKDWLCALIPHDPPFRQGLDSQGLPVKQKYEITYQEVNQ